LASGSNDLKVIIWDFISLEEHKRILDFTTYVVTVKFTLGSHLVVALYN